VSNTFVIYLTITSGHGSGSFDIDGTGDAMEARPTQGQLDY